jgi:parallel beta-helix repeat protein
MASRLIPIALATAALLAPGTARAVDPGSQLITCDHADERVDVTVSSHLDPSCTWTRGLEILASNVTLDCQGASIAAPDRRYGIYIHAPTDTPLTNITVRNCHIEGFLNNIHIEREGFRDLAEGVEYENGFDDILIEDSTSLDSRGVGIFVNGYVNGVTLRNLHVEGAGSSGIYLEAGSTNNVVEDSTIVNNGFGENGPSGQFRESFGISFFFWGTGREGLSIDGSRFNVVRNNVFSGNAAGGIYLYKNCGEFMESRPERWFHRRYGADGNLIESNSFTGGRNGVWIGSRMGENTLVMECSDPQYLPGVSLDYAGDNVVRDNTFTDVTFGVRVEDDDAVVEDNVFSSDDPAHQAIVVGTKYRTEELDQPVAGAVVSGNQAFITGNTNPYRWVFGHTGTVFESNASHGRVVGWCEGVPPVVGPFVMVVHFVAAEPPDPPVVDPVPTLPEPEPLPPCANACASAGAVDKAFLAVKKLDTPPGDDLLSFEGRVTMPHPYSPALDPPTVGVGIVVADAAGGRIVDVQLPGGAFDRATRVGWQTSAGGTSWTWLDKRDAPAGGITKVRVKDLSRKLSGVVHVKITGKRGDYAVDTANLPLTGLVILDPPTAETGQCGEASFAGPEHTCTANGRSVVCK